MFEERPNKFNKWLKNMMSGKGPSCDSEDEQPKKSKKTTKPLKPSKA
jgi:hypothetical protein